MLRAIPGGRIDHGHHANLAFQALHDTVEFNKAVETGLKIVDTSKFWNVTLQG